MKTRNNRFQHVFRFFLTFTVNVLFGVNWSSMLVQWLSSFLGPMTKKTSPNHHPSTTADSNKVFGWCIVFDFSTKNVLCLKTKHLCLGLISLHIVPELVVCSDANSCTTNFQRFWFYQGCLASLCLTNLVHFVHNTWLLITLLIIVEIGRMYLFFLTWFLNISLHLGKKMTTNEYLNICVFSSPEVIC